MNYELAKRLMEAGFPFKWDSELMKLGEGYMYPTPTLEELIEACGLEFNGLHAERKEPLGEITAWTASAFKIKTSTPLFGRGETMQEAVANLWLALNKKP